VNARERGGPAASHHPGPPPPLRIREVTVRFAGLTALDGVSLTVAPGTVHALIGPNGAGKSTCFNVLSGLCRPDAGQVLLGGTDLTRLAPHRIAALGLARTFQNLVTTGTTVADNLMLGRHALSRAGYAATALTGSGPVNSPNWSASAPTSTPPSPTSPTATANASNSPAPCAWSPGYCSWTNRWPA
jgi:branched-chain amino acid transport system ATP-binding protein